MDAPPRRQITLPGGQRSCREPVSRPVVTTGAGHPIRVQAEPAEGPDPIEEPLQRRLGMDVNRRLVSAAIATAAAALFATGVVSTATAQEVLRGQRLQGQERMQDIHERVQGQECLQRPGLRTDDRKGLRRQAGPRLIRSMERARTPSGVLFFFSVQMGT
jgi:hypothetical protein